LNYSVLHCIVLNYSVLDCTALYRYNDMYLDEVQYAEVVEVIARDVLFDDMAGQTWENEEQPETIAPQLNVVPASDRG
jgi:hypothetical protein